MKLEDLYLDKSMDMYIHRFSIKELILIFSRYTLKQNNRFCLEFFLPLQQYKLELRIITAVLDVLFHIPTLL